MLEDTPLHPLFHMGGYHVFFVPYDLATWPALVKSRALDPIKYYGRRDDVHSCTPHWLVPHQLRSQEINYEWSCW